MQLNLRIAIWNANGLPNHTQELEVFLKSKFIDVLLVSETHFTNKTYFCIRGYDLINTNHPSNRAHAGSCILIKNTLKYEILDGIRKTFVQATCIKIKSRDGDLLVSSVYFPPRQSIGCRDYE